MTIRQILLKAFYPLIMLQRKISGTGDAIQIREGQQPVVSLYDLTIQLNNGKLLNLSELKGRKILFVNTASNCGYTAQYGELETLYSTHRDKLEVIGFPANDFKQQEPLDDAAIAEFCKINFGVSFPLAQKSTVIKETGQHPVFSWLTHKEQNGWCDQQPLWNFCKYLVDEEGKLIAFFAQSISPLQEELVKLI